MSSAPVPSVPPWFSAPGWFKWLPVGLGLLVLYVPTIIDLSNTIWRTDAGGLGPIILAVTVWLIWRKRKALMDSAPDARLGVTGDALIVLGLIFYVLGRSQEFVQFEVASSIPLLYGAVLRLRGKEAARQLWFPIFFLCFVVPLPGSLLDSLLIPLKKAVSAVVENILYAFGYPVGRSGVVLIIGPYQLLIADACSGLNSMIALSGIGLLFVYLMKHQSRTYNILLLGSILPIAFFANIVRVLLLMLATYYFGDRAGHIFHDYAGYLEIIVAFGAFFAFDAMAAPLFRGHREDSKTHKGPAASEAAKGVP